MRHHRFGFECASCDTIRLKIPEDADEFSLIRCAQCDSILGQWGKIQDIFLGELGNGVFDLNDGGISEVLWQWPPRESRLEMACRHVTGGAVRVARQHNLVESLRRGGYPA